MNKILIIKLGALGDVVMATALIDAIVRFHPEAAAHVLTTAPFRDLFGSWPRLAIEVVDRHGWRTALAPVPWLRRMRFDRIYDLQGNDRSGLWCALSGSPQRVGNHSRYPYTHHPAQPWRGQCHIFERMTEVLASAGITDVTPVPRLPSTAAQRKHVDAWLRAHDLTQRPFALLHAGASPRRPEKIWPHFAAFAARLEASGVNVVWLGAEADRSRNAALAVDAGIDATGEFAVPELAILGRHARFAVTNDSGPMHVLAASRIPLFGLFGPSDWRRNHALGQGHRAIACPDTARRQGHRQCMDAIPVDLVWSRLHAEGLVAD